MKFKLLSIVQLKSTKEIGVVSGYRKVGDKCEYYLNLNGVERTNTTYKEDELDLWSYV